MPIATTAECYRCAHIPADIAEPDQYNPKTVGFHFILFSHNVQTKATAADSTVSTIGWVEMRASRIDPHFGEFLQDRFGDH